LSTLRTRSGSLGPADDRGERSFHQLHDDPAALRIDRIHAEHVVVLKLREKLGLAQKSLAVTRIAPGRFVQFLDRHFAPERQIVAAVHDGVRAAT
jgi:hypothetical protein